MSEITYGSIKMLQITSPVPLFFKKIHKITSLPHLTYTETAIKRGVILRFPGVYKKRALLFVDFVKLGQKKRHVFLVIAKEGFLDILLHLI